MVTNRDLAQDELPGASCRSWPAGDGGGLVELESIIGRALPEAFKRAYRIHNGQATDEVGLFDGTELLSATAIADQYRIWKELLDDGQFAELHSQSPAGIKTDWWSPGWIPITHNGGGDHSCLDLDPAAGGTVGQIISFWHDEPSRAILAPDFETWLTQYADALEAGELVSSEDYAGVVRRDNV